MRLVTVVLIVLLGLIQYPLWWGHGGWLQVHELEQQLALQKQKNAELKARSDRLLGEVQDLQQGTDASEEHARYELGMIKDSEIFVQFVSPNQPIPAQTALQAEPASSTRGQVSAAPLKVVPEPAVREVHSKPGKDGKGKAAAKAAPVKHTTTKPAGHN
jgi:cell division protein FtsB